MALVLKRNNGVVALHYTEAALRMGRNEVVHLDVARQLLERIESFFDRKNASAVRVDSWSRYLHGNPERIESMLTKLRGELP